MLTVYLLKISCTYNMAIMYWLQNVKISICLGKYTITVIPWLSGWIGPEKVSGNQTKILVLYWGWTFTLRLNSHSDYYLIN